MPWVRARLSVIGLLCPFLVWSCYYVISGRYASRRNLILKLLPWALISSFLMIVPFTEAFKPSTSRPDNIINGPLYTVYLGVMLLCLVSVCVASMTVAPRLKGIRQLEFKFITITFGYVSLAVILLTLLHTLFPALWFLYPVIRTLSFLVFLVFGVSAWSVTSKRIYESSQLLLPIAERSALITVVGFLTAGALRGLPTFDQSLWGAAAAIALACLAYCYLDERMRGLLNLKSEQRTSTVAKRLQATASGELSPDKLLLKFESILGDFTDGVRVRILTREQEALERGELVLPTRELEQTSLVDEGWVSGVSLARVSNRGEHDSLRVRLEREGIHLLVGPHWNDNEPGLVVAFDERENRVPFTHPEIRILRQLAEVADGLHTRARLLLQARQADQLATIGLVGAGLAHELRNPIVAIDTFAQLLPQRLDDPQFLREFAEVVPGEARRIQAMAEQLLDLSRPRKYDFASVDLNEVIAEALVLTRKPATDVRVTLHTEPGATNHHIMADPKALRQVLLNLILNGIQSIAGTGNPGRINVRTLDATSAVAIEVEDTGPGIPEAVRSRLFRPFASAGKERGLGLGLAICAEIAKIHQGTIRAESRPGGGACFRLTLPTATDVRLTA